MRNIRERKIERTLDRWRNFGNQVNVVLRAPIDSHTSYKPGILHRYSYQKILISS